MKRILIMFSVFLVTGCSITQTVKPVEDIQSGTELCVIEDPDVREGFLATYSAALQDKGLKVNMLSPHASTGDCEWTSTYTANWSWDLALYMRYAKISIFRDDWLYGEALYDSTTGSGNFGKFIDAEPKIREMVDQLFPNL